MNFEWRKLAGKDIIATVKRPLGNFVLRVTEKEPWTATIQREQDIIAKGVFSTRPKAKRFCEKKVEEILEVERVKKL